MLKTLLIPFESQIGMVGNKVDDKIGNEYSSSGNASGGGLIEKSAKSKNFKNLKSKNHWIYRRI